MVSKLDTATMRKSMSTLCADISANHLDQMQANLAKFHEDSMGYPIAKDFDYNPLYKFLKFPMNNLGDPFVEGTYKVHSYDAEREVIEFFAHLFRAPMDDYWGYVTNGGSESNLYGLYVARELHPNGLVYLSEDTHYSVKKAIHILNMEFIVIKSQSHGEIDYNDFERAVEVNRHRPAIVLATFGTTMTEAKDNVGKLKSILRSMAIYDHYIHCDAALAGPFGPFIDEDVSFDFEDGADSIAISGHKFIGSPMPCGVLVTRLSYRNKIAKGVSYIGSMDSTITGSRNGHSPLFLWYAIKQLGSEGLASRYKHSLKIAIYCERKLSEIGVEAWRNPGAITVVMPNLADTVKAKRQLASEVNRTHVICMPNFSFDQVDGFIEDILESRGNLTCINREAI